MTEAPWPSDFAEILREVLHRLPTDAELEPGARLLELGLDSLGVITVLTEIDYRFGVDLTGELADLELFTTAGYLWTRLASLSDQSAGSIPAD